MEPEGLSRLRGCLLVAAMVGIAVCAIVGPLLWYVFLYQADPVYP